MKTIRIPIMIAAALLLGEFSQAQESKPGATDEKPKSAPVEKPKPAAAELEAQFKATMTKATMTGRWCSINDGALGPLKEDKYTIVSVNKLAGDSWIINARVQYNNRDFVAPIPVQVKWAGDAPVLIVDKIPAPGGGVFSARVLIYDHTYSGTWSGGDHGGLISGVITNEKEDKAPETNSNGAAK